MQQELAYYADTYEEQAQTRVIAIGDREGAPWVAVERCLFHPQGGGQPADRGRVDGHEIVPVREHESGLVVALGGGESDLSKFSVGQHVETVIDLPLRMAHAALHTAGHLIEAAGRAQGWILAANNHFPGEARIEFTAQQPDARLDTSQGREDVVEALRAYVAAGIAKDLAVTWVNDGSGRRIVCLDGLHSAPCGGTHVHSLGDLVDVVLSNLRVKKGRIRVSYQAAHRTIA